MHRIEVAVPKMRPRKEDTGYDKSVIARKNLDNKRITSNISGGNCTFRREDLFGGYMVSPRKL